jgi:hypothetical protein
MAAWTKIKTVLFVLYCIFSSSISKQQELQRVLYGQKKNFFPQHKRLNAEKVSESQM